MWSSPQGLRDSGCKREVCHGTTGIVARDVPNRSNDPLPADEGQKPDCANHPTVTQSGVLTPQARDSDENKSPTNRTASYDRPFRGQAYDHERQ